MTNAHGRRGDVKTFRQAHGLTLAFVDDDCCFHNRVASMLLLRLPIYHVSRLRVKLAALLRDSRDFFSIPFSAPGESVRNRKIESGFRIDLVVLTKTIAEALN